MSLRAWQSQDMDRQRPSWPPTGSPPTAPVNQLFNDFHPWGAVVLGSLSSSPRQQKSWPGPTLCQRTVPCLKNRPEIISPDDTAQHSCQGRAENSMVVLNVTKTQTERQPL